MPFSDNDLIRVEGEIGRAFVSCDQRYQVVILGKHPLASLAVLYFHEKDHSGRGLTLNIIREKILITIRNSKTLICKIINELYVNNSQSLIWWVSGS